MEGEQNENKRRKLKSNVWAEFTKCEIDGRECAKCNHCGSKFDGSSKKGTTHLRNHLKSKICRDGRKGGDGNEDESIMCMKEKSSVIDFIKSSSDAPVLNSRKAEILQGYEEEMKFLNKLPCRCSLSFVEELAVHQIGDAVRSMVYEANARVRDPVYGCVGVISSLQKQIDMLHTQLALAQAEVVHLRVRQTASLSRPSPSPSPSNSSSKLLASQTRFFHDIYMPVDDCHDSLWT